MSRSSPDDGLVVREVLSYACCSGGWQLATDEGNEGPAFAELKHDAPYQRLAGYPFAFEQRSVGAAEILNPPAGPLAIDLRVVSAHAVNGQTHLTVAVTAKPEGR